MFGSTIRITTYNFYSSLLCLYNFQFIFQFSLFDYFSYLFLSTTKKCNAHNSYREECQLQTTTESNIEVLDCMWRRNIILNHRAHLQHTHTPDLWIHWIGCKCISLSSVGFPLSHTHTPLSTQTTHTLSHFLSAKLN